MYIPQQLRHRNPEAVFVRYRQDRCKQHVRDFCWLLVVGLVLLLAALPIMNYYDLWMENRLEKVAALYYETGECPWGFDDFGGEISFCYLPLGPRKVVSKDGEVYYSE